MDIEAIKKIPLDNILVLDTETTGVDSKAEVLQFSAIWANGTEAMNTYIKPVHTTEWPRAMAVNHISPADVAGCPDMSEVKESIETLLGQSKAIVGYNLPFDLNMLYHNGVELPSEDEVEYIDLMIPFAEVCGEWNDYYQDYKWQKLVTCAGYYGYDGGSYDDNYGIYNNINKYDFDYHKYENWFVKASGNIADRVNLSAFYTEYESKNDTIIENSAFILNTLYKTNVKADNISIGGVGTAIDLGSQFTLEGDYIKHADNYTDNAAMWTAGLTYGEVDTNKVGSWTLGVHYVDMDPMAYLGGISAWDMTDHLEYSMISGAKF